MNAVLAITLATAVIAALTLAAPATSRALRPRSGLAVAEIQVCLAAERSGPFGPHTLPGF
ncbi:MAG: hypothetical protein JWN03_7727 [Nocardia sp.]|nr:hypothetical protein [Nocardia sp.]